ncbi:restriction endonuclease [Neisseria dentiae]|uniref:Restriction endonuclease n=1 Tax=Neisseria dentiae TaxID=194197 RepID=A0A1X3DA01_9NEIS|nr:restriction endonuclease subunit S [Neisseria dentiae]OSI16733.1 restriction endonuclease [Neisseria dentiae]QMT46360.1 restriction endonuclease subunit S [Neisseria dentiae]STZ52634.1 type I restriction enzyme [Neisseria dentiae]
MTTEIPLPQGWEKSTLGEIATYINGRAFKPTEWSKAGTPIIRIQNLNNPNAEYNYYVGNIEKKYHIENGDLLFAWSASLGAYIWKGENAFLNQHIFKVLPKENVDKTFVYYLLNNITNELYTKAHGSGMVHVTKGKFEATLVNIPPLETQQTIVDKIESLFAEIDAGIACLKTAGQQLKQYRQALLKNAFNGELTKQWRLEHADSLPSEKELLAQIQTARQQHHDRQLADWQTAVKQWEQTGTQGKKPSKPKAPTQAVKFEGNFSDLPNGWGVIKLGNFIQDIQAGKSFKCEERPPADNEIGVAKVSAVTWGEYDENETKTCFNENMINPDFFIKTGDFLFSRANTIELVGACVIVKKTNKNIMLSDKTLRIDFTEILKEYVLYYLRSSDGRKQIMDKSSGNQDSMRNIGQERIKDINIPLCSLAEQTQIVAILESKLTACDQLAAELATQLKQAELLKQAVLKAAFSGRLSDDFSDGLSGSLFGNKS